MSKLTLLITFVMLLVTASAEAAVADCVAEAEARVNGPNQKGVATAIFLDAEFGSKGRPLKVNHPCQKGPCRQVFYSMSEPAVEAPLGFELESEYRVGGVRHWGTILRGKGAQCEILHALKFKAIASGAVGASRDPVAASEPDDPRTVTPMLSGVNLTKDLDTYKSRGAVSLTNEATLGTAQGLEEAATEAIQILGQIVVDRASAEAYLLLKTRLEKLLGCGQKATPASPAVTPPKASPPSPAVTLPKPTFPATCKVLKPLRLQDVATSRDILFGAFAADSVGYLARVQASLPADVKNAEKVGVASLIAATVVPLIVRPSILADVEPARVLLGAILAHVKTLDGASLTRAETALAAGVLGYVKCVEIAQSNTHVTLANCDFATFTDQYSGADVAIRLASRSIAAKLITVATLNTPDGRADVRQRVVHAVDIVFASACMLLGDKEEAPQFLCPPAPDHVDGEHLSMVQLLSFLQPIVDAALEGDSNALVVAVANPVEVFANWALQKSEADGDDERQSHQKAFLLLGSLLQYSVTFAQEDASKTSAQLHEQRTKILESLTRDMTDRTARDGDDIWSFGGSLRFLLGVRKGKDASAFWGPLGLPLGLGFDHVAANRACGIHLEFSPLDIGQYVSYDNGGTVKTPEFADAFAPSVTIGVGWGKSVPLIVGATAGYSPALKLSATSDTKGAFNVGVILGMYVPFIDMN